MYRDRYENSKYQSLLENSFPWIKGSKKPVNYGQQKTGKLKNMVQFGTALCKLKQKLDVEWFVVKGEKSLRKKRKRTFENQEIL